MIGVIGGEKEKESVREFFELFKTPWEFYAPGKDYSVIISTLSDPPQANQKLTILCISDQNQFSPAERISIQSRSRNASVECRGIEIPIYGDLIAFKGIGQPFMRVKGRDEVAGITFITPKSIRVVLGYNIFEEIRHLLSVGQPRENALNPTVDHHISLIRNLIVEAGIPVIEIPPTPAGYDFTVCLTHDIDFAGIRNHKLDHTMFGFLYRASVGSLIRLMERKISATGLLRNWSAVLRLPFVYLGLARDFWLQFGRYVEIEKDLKSTFFFVPFKDSRGDQIPSNGSRKRATRYDISDMGEIANTLIENGFEIGIHGIDAWHSVEKACQERDRIRKYLNEREVGIRIHWLFLRQDSYGILERAGISYDSTLGYNDAVGYRAGTLQVFKPLGLERLLELPLHIQDTALFYPERMNLSKKEASEVCQKIIDDARSRQGVLTILWHDRSLGPERQWGEFYLNLLGKIRESKVWFATAGEIIRWFRKRRALMFKDLKPEGDKIKLSLGYQGDMRNLVETPDFSVRVHLPRPKDLSSLDPGHVDFPLNGRMSLEIPFTMSGS